MRTPDFDTAAPQYQAALATFTRLTASSGDTDTRLPQDVCRIYDASAANDEDHNCLACVLHQLLIDCAELLDTIVSNEDRYISDSESPLGFRLLSSLINTFWEVVLDAFELLGIDTSKSHAQAFSSFRSVRSWTNFFKHPSVFGYKVHHPRYVHAGTVLGADAENRDHPSACIVDSDDVRDHWQTSDKKELRKRLEKLLGGRMTAIVVLPNVDELALNLEREIQGVVEVLCARPFAMKLEAISTTEDFFCDDDPLAVYEPDLASLASHHDYE